MQPGPRNLITDVPGLLVGNATDRRRKTGCTVLLGEAPFVAGYHVMGGAPGTRETDLLGPDKSVDRVDALVLSGGSAFGLDAGSGVADGLAGLGRGFPVGAGQALVRVPIVPAAILFDLLNGGDKDWLGYGGTDSQSQDPGPQDTGLKNNGPQDTGHQDTGPQDTGPHETGPHETEPPETGASDSGQSDTGHSDTGHSDTGHSDTGQSDTGQSDTHPSVTLSTGPNPPDTGAQAGRSALRDRRDNRLADTPRSGTNHDASARRDMRPQAAGQPDRVHRPAPPADNPYKSLGRAALAAAARDFGLGSAGAGTGATTATLKGGLGSASIVLPGGIVVGALVAVNALGSATVGETEWFWAAPFEAGDEFGGRGPARVYPAGRPATKGHGGNTTIGIVATNAALTKAQCTRLATAAHDGIGRALVPSHTAMDGDLIFAAATGAVVCEDLIWLGHAAATCMARAIARGVYLATPAPGDLVPTWQHLWGSTRPDD